jgi:hypothetical protein
LHAWRSDFCASLDVPLQPSLPPHPPLPPQLFWVTPWLVEVADPTAAVIAPAPAIIPAIAALTNIFLTFEFMSDPFPCLRTVDLQFRLCLCLI